MFDKEGLVGGIDGGKIRQVFDKHRSFNDLPDRESGGFNDGFHVLQRLARLFGNVLGHGAVQRINRQLTGGDGHRAEIDALHVRADSGRRVSGGNNHTVYPSNGYIK